MTARALLEHPELFPAPPRGSRKVFRADGGDRGGVR